MIKRLEFKKLITSPIILMLFLLFSGFNLFYILQQAPMREEMNLLQPIVAEHGTLMDRAGRVQLQASYEQELDDWNALAKRKTGDIYETANEFFLPENYYPVIESNTYTEKELEEIYQLAIKESYLFKVNEMEAFYNNLDVMKSAEEQIVLFELSGSAAETVRRQYESLKPRLQELIENKEHLHLFFQGERYATHSLLFKTLFGFIIFQVMILTVLFTAFLVNYEFEQKTSLITYSTKRGRKLVRDKFFVALFSTIFSTIILLGTTLCFYFLVFNYSGLWNVPISTGLLIEFKLPFISWWNLSFGEYLLLSSMLVVVCQVLFCLFTFCLSLWIRNSYIVFIVFGIILGAAILLPGYMPRDGMLLFYTQFTPFALILGSKKWWMESGAFTTFQYYEIITSVTWLAILVLVALLSVERFTRQNL